MPQKHACESNQLILSEATFLLYDNAKTLIAKSLGQLHEPIDYS